jgi:calcium-independent phospholipase A2-gamma
MLFNCYTKGYLTFHRKVSYFNLSRARKLKLNAIKRRNYSSDSIKREIGTIKSNSNDTQESVISKLTSYSSSLLGYLEKIRIISAPSIVNFQKSISTRLSKIVKNNTPKDVKNSPDEKKNPTNTNNFQNQNLNLKQAVASSSSNSSDPNAHEKISNLCNSLEKATSYLVKSSLVSNLFKILYDSDEDVRHLIYKTHKNILPALLELQKNTCEKKEKSLYENINECLTLLGHVEPHSFRNLNILSLDGGGAKGFVTIEILKNIEKQCGGKPIHEIFDYICGVSTGAVLACLLGVYKMPLDDCERNYKKFIREIFQRNKAAGLMSSLMSYSYYDTQCWETLLKEIMGETLMINSSRVKNNCKISVVSNVTTPNHMKVYLFRNYNLPTSSNSHYDGTARFKVWEAIRASSAAPFYYEDFKLDGYVFHDGGLLANNPTVIALHEARQLWPETRTSSIVSIGNGRFKPAGYASSKASSISLRQKITRVISGMSCTENIHTMLLELLPSKSYFRFNPYMPEEFHLDENRPIKWKLMQYETNMYMRRNEHKFKLLAERLLMPKISCQFAKNYVKEKLKL